MKRKQGISLIVLIITIIVIVVLATAVILSIANNNPIDNAKNAKDVYNQKTLEEAANLEYATLYTNAKINGEAIDKDAMTNAIRNNLKEQGFSETDVAKVTVTENGISIEDTTNAITFTKKEELVLGKEVTSSTGEEFYIIGGDTVGTEISSSTQDIILLSKYNLKVENHEITLKQDTSGNTNGCAFSSTNYWSSVDGITYPADLNDEEKYPIGSATSVITTAKEYGKSLGVTGRLMTYEEAKALQTNYSEILYGNEKNDSLSYWLSTVESNVNVDQVSHSVGIYPAFPDDGYYFFGVRPVITVSKSLIK